ncbi:MAG: TRAM domain-containing protein, partial [Pseudomonadota bacterium]|nr:TRAM domain-containing protein [Pseudomonadota bacterium]
PGLALSSDFIVGHPGETDAEFQATLNLVRRIEFAQAFSFKYSSRPGTPAASAPGHVPEDVKHARLQELLTLLREQQEAFNRRTEGLVLPVLFTGPGRRPGQLSGRTPYLQPVHVSGPLALIGSETDVRIARATTTSLLGTLDLEKMLA